ncbi:MAG: tRNA (N(6)-L-threonylcarbamoyladenosine(37)-C(2))-methylthiotransferase MtaB [Bacteroidota bacterium]
MKRIALHTLGCKLNYAETAAIGKQFTSRGYIVVGLDDPADVVVINSCSVTSQADRECRQLVRRAIRHSPDAFVAVVGCYAQLQSEQIAGINGVDLVLGTQDKFSLLDFIDTEKKKNHANVVVSCIDDNNFGLASSAGFEDRTRAFLKVQDGCDYRCTYCTIPQARGRSRSTTIVEIVRQAREAVGLGYKEIVLTGVNVGDYGKNDGTNLLALLKQLVTVDGLMRIRISSVEPNLLTDELLDFWFANDILCHHWHIPLQSGSNTILRKMRRRYLTGVYAERVERIKSNVPTAGIGSDVIVGFPGESDALFNETCNFLNDIPISYFHIFSYSERPNTPAAAFDKKIDPQIKAKRSKKLRQLGIQKRHMFYETFVGKTVPVLFESAHLDGTLSGLTEEYVRVDVKSNADLTNTIVNVTIKEAFSEKCIGMIAEPNRIPAIRIAI